MRKYTGGYVLTALIMYLLGYSVRFAELDGKTNG